MRAALVLAVGCALLTAPAAAQPGGILVRPGAATTTGSERIEINQDGALLSMTLDQLVAYVNAHAGGAVAAGGKLDFADAANSALIL